MVQIPIAMVPLITWIRMRITTVFQTLSKVIPQVVPTQIVMVRLITWIPMRITMAFQTLSRATPQVVQIPIVMDLQII